MFPSTAAKVRTLDATRAWRQSAPAPLVFTNGVFDLLHRGHVEYLEAARALGATLLVAVNTDRSARGLGKTGQRPIVPQDDRARVLAGLAAVDCVVLFDDPTPLALIDALRPDVLAKGGDYARDAIVGADLVESRGGRVVVIPLVPGHSTSLIVERLRASP